MYESERVIIWGKISFTCKSCSSYHWLAPYNEPVNQFLHIQISFYFNFHTIVYLVMDMYTIIFTNFPFGLWNERKNILKIGLFYVIWILVFFVLNNFLFSINPFPPQTPEDLPWWVKSSGVRQSKIIKGPVLDSLGGKVLQ